MPTVAEVIENHHVSQFGNNPKWTASVRKDRGTGYWWACACVSERFESGSGRCTTVYRCESFDLKNQARSQAKQIREILKNGGWHPQVCQSTLHEMGSVKDGRFVYSVLFQQGLIIKKVGRIFREL